jgi:hypothetical protein
MAAATAESDVQVDEGFSGFASMTPEQRESYVSNLHTDLATDKAEQKAREDAPLDAPEPGKTPEESGLVRGEDGRFIKRSDAEERADYAAYLQRKRYPKGDETTPPTTTETPSTPVKDDETPVVDDAAPGAKPGQGEEVQDWRDAEVKDLATQYGIDETKLAKIPNREVLDVLLETINRKAFEEGKTAAKPAEPADAKPAEPTAANAEKTTTEDALAILESLKLGDPDGNLALEDREPIQKAFKALAAEVKEGRTFRKEMQAFIGTVKQREAHAAFAKLKSDFTASVDSLGNTELFGKPGERTKEQAANLEKVFNDGHLPHARGLMAQGRQVGPTPTFAKAAVNLLFGDQLIEKAKQQHLAALKKSAARRTGGGVTKPNPLPKDATALQRNLAEANENWRATHPDE